MPHEWNPFQYGPNGTDLSRWEWIDSPRKPSPSPRAPGRYRVRLIRSRSARAGGGSRRLRSPSTT